MYLGNHPAFHQGPKVSANTLWTEFTACLRFGLDPDVYFQKDRFSRMMIVGGIVADGAISTMRQFDAAKEREAEAKRKGKK